MNRTLTPRPPSSSTDAVAAAEEAAPSKTVYDGENSYDDGDDNSNGSSFCFTDSSSFLKVPDTAAFVSQRFVPGPLDYRKADRGREGWGDTLHSDGSAEHTNRYGEYYYPTQRTGQGEKEEKEALRQGEGGGEGGERMASATSYYFVVVGTKDNPLYEAEFGTWKQGGDGVPKFREDQRHMNQFIAHSSLDCVEDVQWVSKDMYLKTVDKFGNQLVSCFLTGGNIKFLLVHEIRADESIRQFFSDVYELYVKTLMNPFYEVNMPIRSQVFDQRVRAAAKKFL